MPIMASTFILSFAVLLCCLSAASCVCPNGWTRYESSCYALYEGGTAWNAASVLCQEFGGHLATLNTTDKIKNAKLFLEYINHNVNVWIGGSDIGLEGIYLWNIDQEPLAVSDWAKGEPNRGSAENCLAMSSKQHYQWVDLPCGSKYDYLCERVSV